MNPSSYLWVASHRPAAALPASLALSHDKPVRLTFDVASIKPTQTSKAGSSRCLEETGTPPRT